MTREPGEQLTDAQLRLVLDAIAALAPGQAHDFACPRCGGATLTVERTPCPPHAVWYDLACSSCGVKERIQLNAGAAD